MPFSVSVRPLATPLAVRARAAGGYERVDRPNPNDAIEALKRHGLQSGTNTILPVGRAGNANPALTASGESALGQNIGLEQRALAVSRGQAAERAAAPLTDYRKPLYLADPRLEALKQALFEAGAGRLRTGARAGMDGPGFFDTQAGHLLNPSNSENALLQELARQAGRR